MTENKSRENYTRVTKILYPFSGLEKVPQEVVAKAGIRGTKVHKICEGIISGLGELGVDPETFGYVESFKKWWGDGKDVLMMEERFYDDDLEITGQVDLVLNTPEGPVLVDLKTSYAPSKTWAVQGNAYAYIAKNHNLNIVGIYFLHLNKTGKEPRIYEYDVDPSLFLAVVRTWQYFFQEGA